VGNLKFEISLAQGRVIETYILKHSLEKVLKLTFTHKTLPVTPELEVEARE
jgi:hypothetical protein